MKKSKPESNFINMLLTLVVIAVVSGFSLGVAYVTTKEPIALSKKIKLENAIRSVLPDFDTVINLSLMPEDGKDSLKLYIGKKGEEIVGTAVETYTNNGFGGRIDVMVGFDESLTITKTQVLKHAETPGLGDKMEIAKSDWSEQFFSKNPETYKLKVVKDGGDVDAITAATITSRAYCDAITRAYVTLKNNGGDK